MQADKPVFNKRASQGIAPFLAVLVLALGGTTPSPDMMSMPCSPFWTKTS